MHPPLVILSLSGLVGDWGWRLPVLRQARTRPTAAWSADPQGGLGLDKAPGLTAVAATSPITSCQRARAVRLARARLNTVRDASGSYVRAADPERAGRRTLFLIPAAIIGLISGLIASLGGQTSTIARTPELSIGISTPVFWLPA